MPIVTPFASGRARGPVWILSHFPAVVYAEACFNNPQGGLWPD